MKMKKQQQARMKSHMRKSRVLRITKTNKMTKMIVRSFIVRFVMMNIAVVSLGIVHVLSFTVQSVAGIAIAVNFAVQPVTASTVQASMRIMIVLSFAVRYVSLRNASVSPGIVRNVRYRMRNASASLLMKHFC
jgi:hypothetical protein